MEEITAKSKFKTKKLRRRIVIDEKEVIEQKAITEKFNRFFVNIRPKLLSKIPVSNTYFEQSVGSNLESKELCDEEIKKFFSSLKSKSSPGYVGISSNSVLEEIFGVLKYVLNFSINQGVFPQNMKIACVTPIFRSCDEYFLI